MGWARRSIVFHGKRHPRELGAKEVTAFLSSVAAAGASTSTQNQALSALLFLYEVVFGRRLEWMHEMHSTLGQISPARFERETAA